MRATGCLEGVQGGWQSLHDGMGQAIGGHVSCSQLL